MPAPLQITQRSTGSVVILELSGQLKADEGDQEFRTYVAEIVRTGWTHVLINLAGVTHMDSGGAGTLVATYLHVVRRGGRLKLLGPTDRLRRVLEVTHLISVFDIYDNEDDALRSFEPEMFVTTLRL
jgi:anti-sigma B factor antagonist